MPAPDIRLTPLPYNAGANDPILSGDTDDNLCHLYSPTNLRHCVSQRCLLTGKVLGDDKSKYEVCCAWDLHIFLFADNKLKEEFPNLNVTIPSAFLTMDQASGLLHHMKQASSEEDEVTVVLSTRYIPQHNASSILIWLLGVLVCALASYLSAGDYNDKKRRLLQRRHYGSLESSENDSSQQPESQSRRVIRLAPGTPKEQRDSDLMDSAHVYPLQEESL